MSTMLTTVLSLAFLTGWSENDLSPGHVVPCHTGTDGSFQCPTVWKLITAFRGVGPVLLVDGMFFQDSNPASLRAWLGMIVITSPRQSIICIVSQNCVIRPLSSFQPLIFYLLTGIPCAINLPLASECGKAGCGILFTVGVPGACTWHTMAVGRSCPWTLSRGKPLGRGLGRLHLEFSMPHAFNLIPLLLRMFFL